MTTANKINTDTTIETNHGDPNFPPMGERLAWRYEGETRWSQLYAPTSEAKRWDGAPAEALAVGSRFGCFGYVVVKVTGRKLTRIPGSGGWTMGTKARVTFDPGTEDERTLDAWIVEG